MNKTLTSASVTAVLALASFGALADGPNFYGRLELAVTNTDASSTVQSGTNNASVGDSGTYLENNFSNVGVKGSEKLSDGIEAVYQMEFQVENTSSKGDTFKARNTYLGLKSAAGTVLVGRNDTVFKQSEGGVDLFGNTNGDMDRLLTGQTRSADGVWYYSPKIADLLAINATYLFDDNNDTDDNQYAISITLGDKALKKQAFYAAAAYNKGISGVDAYRGVAQVKLGEFKLGGLYQHTERATDSSVDGDSFIVNLAYNLNGVNLKAEYGQDDAGFGKYFKSLGGVAGADAEVQNIILGADYRVSKSTMVFGHYAMYEGEYQVEGVKVDLKDENVFTVGVRYDF
ncbi:porin [Shewanella sedimentimangrovi]|uniref:Porin n=1 Tax=Shewanella sedimentimangrovi TaxID=2814293 RepID=A0ABX7QZ20_9GAMM|nr:porin [Shewanella sedimentimangrovi]QSX36792.1 porin [Shewanella sedimentimangrovi]